MIISSKFLGRMFIRNENGQWFGYGLDKNNDVIGCLVIAPNTCEDLNSVFEFIKRKICSSVVIEK